MWIVILSAGCAAVIIWNLVLLERVASLEGHVKLWQAMAQRGQDEIASLRERLGEKISQLAALQSKRKAPPKRPPAPTMDQIRASVLAAAARGFDEAGKA